MWMPWQWAVACAFACAAVAAVLPGPLLRRAGGGLAGGDVLLTGSVWRRRAAAAQPYVREAGVVFVLYAMWRGLGEVKVMSTDGALRRGQQLWDLQRALHLPSELTLQRWALKAPVLARLGNWYYVVVHVVPVGIFLAWLFARHRDRYHRWRTTFALSSLVVLVLQWVPVAPPRMYPQLGFVDTGALLGPRVYDDAGAATAGQLSAMPSMHVAWAVAIGIAVWVCARSRWRWIGPAHALLTLYAVCVTGYHWLADGLVAAAVVVLVGVATNWWYDRRTPAAVPETALSAST